MSTGLKIELVERFFSGTGSTYDHIANLCTLGFDIWWKEKILEKIPSGAMQIIDQACGTGILTFRIARRFPHCRVIGVELREEYLNIARQKAERLGFRNIEWKLGRAEDILLDGEFDCIASSYLAKYADLDRLVAGAREMLRSGGTLVMHDFSYPSNPHLAGLWEIYFKPLQTLGCLRYPQWRTIFHELPNLIKETNWKDELIKSLKANRFSNISMEQFTFGTATIISAQI